MHYIRINEQYIDYMKSKEDRIPNQDYGEHKYKPFYILSSLKGDDVLYVTQLTSPKPRHQHLKESMDFKKIFHPKSQKLLGATNLNYMFPVLPEYIEHLSFSDLKEILQDDGKVRTLSLEKKVLDNMELEKSFHELYNLKYEKPQSKTAQRCLDFKQLETYMLTFKLQEQFNRTDIEVERSKDHSTFFIKTSNAIYQYPATILEDMFSFLDDMYEKFSIEEANDLPLDRGMSV